MEELFEQLQRFMGSASCIFELKAMDYPSALQQHLITAHFELNALLKSTPHSEVVRLLHSSVERQLEVFLPGLLYTLVLDFSAAQPIFETYMPILRAESWVGLDRMLQQLIRDSFSALKLHHRPALISVAAKFNYFGQLSCDLLSLLMKAADCFDLSEASLNFNNSLLEVVQSILSQGSESDQLKQVVADRLFYKLLRMLTLIGVLEDETMRDYRNRCASIAYRLFSFSRDRCLAIAFAASPLMRELEADDTMTKLIEEWREQLLRSALPPEGPFMASMRLGMVLPMRVEAAVRFIGKEEVSQMQVGMQMNWAFGKMQEHFELLLIDILRYVLALPPQEMPREQGLYLLEWLFYRSCTNNILFQFWKGELFQPCFAEPCPYPQAPERALRFLAYLLHSNLEFGETLLVYLLRQMSVPSNAKKLHHLLLEADSLHILHINALLANPRLSPRAKAELATAINSSHEVQTYKEGEAQSIYAPLDLHPPVPVQAEVGAEVEVEFSESESSEHMMYDEAVESRPSCDTNMRVKMEKMFAQDLGESLSILMLQPTLPNYKHFFKKLIEEIKAFKLNAEAQTIDLFISETAKITYLLFQHEFEQHSVGLCRDESVVVHLLSTVVTEWRTNSLLGTCCKKIIRRIIDYFGTAEPGIWRQFILHFRRGTMGQVREVKDWLIPKEKADHAVPLLRELGPLTKELIDNAALLKLALS